MNLILEDTTNACFLELRSLRRDKLWIHYLENDVCFLLQIKGIFRCNLIHVLTHRETVLDSS